MIKALITDFDGTLVDTFQANFLAYQKAFAEAGLVLNEDKYRKFYGLRFDEFVSNYGIGDNNTRAQIREAKRQYYTEFFNYLKANDTLVEIINTFHKNGGKTAIASTARKENLMNALNCLNLAGLFDVILTGEDVPNGKPDPEIYIRTMSLLDVAPSEVLIFEDSEVGIEAAKASGARCIRVTPEWFM